MFHHFSFPGAATNKRVKKSVFMNQASACWQNSTVHNTKCQIIRERLRYNRSAISVMVL